MPTAGIILAAGGGTRFAGPGHKLRADAAGTPVVARALDALVASRLELLAVVTGAVAIDDLVPAGVEIVPNAAWESGQASSLAAGVRWARAAGADAIVVGLGDQPGVRSESWRAVAAATATPIAIATYDGHRGHPVRIHRDLWDRLPTEGDAGARALIAASPGQVTEVPCTGDPLDVDTVEDLSRWR